MKPSLFGTADNSSLKSKFILVLRLLAAIILLQTLFFKFTGAAESKYIFQTLGAEPFGRIFSGVVELIASVLLLVPATQVFGALITLGVMSGAILSHFFVLGLVILDDGGLLFGLDCVTFFFSLLILALQLDQVEGLVTKLLQKRQER